VAENLLAAMALGPLKNPEGLGFPGSRNLTQYDAANSWIAQDLGLHWGGVAAAVAVVVIFVLMGWHVLGFQIRVSGESPRAARFAGVRPQVLVVFCMAASGMLAGVAGYFEVSGPSGQISIDFNSGYGFTAIIVAFLGRLHPIGILLASFLMALTYIGGEIAQNQLGLPAAAIQAFQGMLLFFILGLDVFTNYRLKLIQRGAA
jgi:simple sugar transport system permease protein